MRLAVKKEPGFVPNGGFHYMLFPMAMNGPEGLHEDAFRLMGYIIIEVDDDRGKMMLEDARKALVHQIEVALLADAAENKLKDKT